MELMSAREVCEYLHINPNHLYQLVFREKLEVIRREKKRIFFRREDVEAYHEAK